MCAHTPEQYSPVAFVELAPCTDCVPTRAALAALSEAWHVLTDRSASSYMNCLRRAHKGSPKLLEVADSEEHVVQAAVAHVSSTGQLLHYRLVPGVAC